MKKEILNILLVEDNEDVASYIISCLENYNVILASNGVQGKEIAELRVPEIIISDIIMPEMNGYELCKSLKTNVKTDHIPIILLGKQWEELVRWLKKWPLKSGMISQKDLDLLFVANNCNEAIETIDKTYESWKKGGKNFCVNYKKYKG